MTLAKAADHQLLQRKNKMKGWMMINQVFGPVPTRRLGQSLGIDPVPLKTCNWNCVYCQLGRTQLLKTERRDLFDVEEFLDSVRAVLESHTPGDIDWVTFVGSGETTLNSRLGEMIQGVKALTDLPVAVITNGSLLFLPEVRDALVAADAVLPSLDAGNAVLYRRINRPHPDLTFESLTDGLITFRKMYEKQYWIEVMLIEGMNDSEEALSEIADWLEMMAPDQVHIVKPTRPPAETWVQPPCEESLLRAHAILGEVATIMMPAIGSFDLRSDDNLVDAILSIITRHPMKESELVDALVIWSPGEVQQTLQKLLSSGKVQIVTRLGVRFWSASDAHYGHG